MVSMQQASPFAEPQRATRQTEGTYWFFAAFGHTLRLMAAKSPHCVEP